MQIEWISVEEKLPENGRIVLGYDSSWYEMAYPVMYKNGKWNLCFIGNGDYTPEFWTAMINLPTKKPLDRLS